MNVYIDDSAAQTQSRALFELQRLKREAKEKRLNERAMRMRKEAEILLSHLDEPLPIPLGVPLGVPMQMAMPAMYIQPARPVAAPRPVPPPRIPIKQRACPYSKSSIVGDIPNVIVYGDDEYSMEERRAMVMMRKMNMME